MQLSTYRGDWALVTGASSGIGREFALALAAAGMNLALVARRKDRLDELAAELTGLHGVESRVVVADLARPEAPAQIKALLSSESRRIRLVCNNAAFGRWGRFENASAADYQDMVQVNITALVATCHAFLPDLRSFPSSVIINVASAAAYQPVPYMAVYAATKAFVASFSQALYGEWKDYGVLVQTLIPGPTETEFDVVAGAYPSVVIKRVPAAQVVRDSLAHLGAEDPVALSAKGTLAQRFFAGLFPPRVVIREVAKRFRPPE
jgi:short-subunit dehydrogenase